MSTISHDPRSTHDMWVALAIAVIWITVLATALFGPDILTHDAGGSGATIPSGVVFAIIALFGTHAIAKYGFGGRKDT